MSEPPGDRRAPTAVLDSAHIGDIQGAFGTIRQHELGARRSWAAPLLTLLAIMGPGLIVMVGDNDAGGVVHLRAGRPELRPHASCGPFRCSSRSSS